MTRPIDWDDVFNASKSGENDVFLRYIYGFFHENIDRSPIGAYLVGNLLAARTDSDRVRYCEDYAKLVLGITDILDASYFREVVLKKEAEEHIAFELQRDHSVHTIHNYLLGWYFFINCSHISTCFGTHFKIRGIDRELHRAGPYAAYPFGELWCFASLLHDVGYIFEGRLEPVKSLACWDKYVEAGVRKVEQYFNSQFWREAGIRAVDKDVIARITGVQDRPVRLDDADSTMAFLRDLGQVDTIRRIVGDSIWPCELAFDYRDAFGMWAGNYKTFGFDSMAARVEGLEKALESLAEKGIPGNGVRVLDHGICGGLVLLKLSTIWYRLYCALKSYMDGRAGSDADMKVCHDVLERMLSGPPYNPAHYWRSIVWATAAVAVHNVQQFPGYPGWTGKLSLQDDPLAYLGILVDILQDWDRHGVDRLGAIQGSRRCLNSTDVQIGVGGDGRIQMLYGCRRGDSVTGRYERMVDDLDRALEGWNSLVEVSFRHV